MSAASKNGEWEPVIGLEMHARLLTRSKIFSGAASGFCETPNAQICEIDLGMPGVLPTLNRAVVDSAIVFGLAVGGKIAPLCEFARKNYFYPDLSKGYQISQYEHPIVSGGRIEYDIADRERFVNSEKRYLAGGRIRLGDAAKFNAESGLLGGAKFAESNAPIDLTRAHLEEDAGKLMHNIGGGMSGVDYNRAGCPLLEIVTEPQINSPVKAATVALATVRLLRWLGICDGDMQDGSFRIDANVSLRRVGSQTLGTRCEIKNLNSFNFLIRALEFEIERQYAALAGGGVVTQQTRLFDEKSGQTQAMRDKEDADDYRYFPDPDLPPLRVDDEHIEQLRAKRLPKTSPLSPFAARARMEKEYGLSPQVAYWLSHRREIFEYFVRAAASGNAKECANWICGDLMGLEKHDKIPIQKSRVTPENLAELIALAIAGEISGPAAKETLAKMWKSGESAKQIVDRDGLRQTADDDGEWESLAARIVADNPKQAAQFAAGKQKAMGWFVGQAMKQTGGKADPKRLNQIFARLLAPAADD